MVVCGRFCYNFQKNLLLGELFCVCVCVCVCMCVFVCVCVCVCVPVGMVTELVCLTGEGSVASSLGTGIAERSGFQSGFRFLYTC